MTRELRLGRCLRMRVLKVLRGRYVVCGSRVLVVVLGPVRMARSS